MLMMTRAAPLIRRRRQPQQRRDHVPHSSWTHGHRPVTPNVAIAPDEFWNRLGL